MCFLMGLNDSFSQIRIQIVLIDLIPPINKVFSLVTQEEHQRAISSQTNIGNVDIVHSMAFLTKVDGIKIPNSENTRGPKVQKQ